MFGSASICNCPMDAQIPHGNRVSTEAAPLPSKKNGHLTHYLHAGWRFVFQASLLPSLEGSGSIVYTV